MVEELAGAKTEFAARRFVNAALLFAKATFTLVDLVMVKRGLEPPKDHSARFDVLERKFPRFYRMIQRVFKLYRATYAGVADEKACREIKRVIQAIAGTEGIDGEIEKVLEGEPRTA